MSTLLQLYKEGNLVKSLSQQISFANINLLTQELSDLANELKKDIYLLATSPPSEENAYTIVNTLYVSEYISIIYNNLWRAKYISFKNESIALEKVVEKFIITDKFKLKIFQKLLKSTDYISVIENKHITKNYAESELLKLKNQKSKTYLQCKKSLVKTCNKYLQEIYDYRQTKGFAVLTNRVSSDWVSEADSCLFWNNAKVLGQDGPTLLINSVEFIGNLRNLRYAKDREAFFNQAIKADKINTLWNKSLLKKVEIAQMSGYDNYVDFATSKNILNTKEKVQSFLQSKLNQYQLGYDNTMSEMLLLAKKDGNSEVKVSDVRYYLDKVNNYSIGDYYFILDDVLIVLQRFLKENLNIYLKFRELPKVGIHYWMTIKDLEKNKKSSLLLTNTVDSNFTNRSSIYFNKFKKTQSQSIINVDLRDKWMTYQEVGILFHEFGHLLQNFLSTNQYENLSKEIWEIVEVPSMLLETLSKDYQLLKELHVYKDKVEKNKLTIDIFNLLKKESEENVFYKYMEIKKHLIMVQMYSKNYEELKNINPSKYLNKELIKAKVPYLWTDCSNNFMSEYTYDYGVMPYIYNFAQEIVDILIEKIKKNYIIEDNVASTNYIFRNLLTNNDGVSSIDKLKKIYKE